MFIRKYLDLDYFDLVWLDKMVDIVIYNKCMDLKVENEEF